MSEAQEGGISFDYAQDKNPPLHCVANATETELALQVIAGAGKIASVSGVPLGHGQVL